MAKQEPALELVSAKDVKVRPVKWLWPFLIPNESQARPFCFCKVRKAKASITDSKRHSILVELPEKYAGR